MADKDRIQLSIQLPENALEQLSHLAGQLQGILETVLGGPAGGRTPETGENFRFDPQRFRDLGAEELTQEAGIRLKAPPGTEAAPSEALPQIPVTPAELSVLPEAEGSMQPDFSDMPELHGTTAEPRLDEEPSSGGWEPRRELVSPKRAYREIASAAEAQGGAWGMLSQTSSVPENAPMTAEDVSQAFCRDDRRYDSGFPLY